MGRCLLAGVIGDDHPDLPGYRVIREALRHAAHALHLDLETQWLPTSALGDEVETALAAYDALWCGPWGPYQNTNAALRAIRFAREHGRTAAVGLDPASRTAGIYHRTIVAERYRCRFGLNPEYLTPLHRGGLRVTGVDELGMATVVEFPDHPFFLATLFLPERTSRAGAPHPLITAYLKTAAETSGMSR